MWYRGNNVVTKTCWTVGLLGGCSLLRRCLDRQANSGLLGVQLRLGNIRRGTVLVDLSRDVTRPINSYNLRSSHMVLVCGGNAKPLYFFLGLPDFSLCVLSPVFFTAASPKALHPSLGLRVWWLINCMYSVLVKKLALIRFLVQSLIVSSESFLNFPGLLLSSPPFTRPSSLQKFRKVENWAKNWFADVRLCCSFHNLPDDTFSIYIYAKQKSDLCFLPRRWHLT